MRKFIYQIVAFSILIAAVFGGISPPPLIQKTQAANNCTGKIVLYENANYNNSGSGSCLGLNFAEAHLESYKCTQSNTCSHGNYNGGNEWNDEASSMKIFDPTLGVFLYPDSNFQGNPWYINF